MLLVTKTVHVEPGGEVDRLLDEAAEGPIVLERDGVRYRLGRLEDETDENVWDAYDPEKARAGMRAAAGSWSDIDAEAFIRSIYRAREAGSRPPDRPRTTSSTPKRLSTSGSVVATGQEGRLPTTRTTDAVKLQ